MKQELASIEIRVLVKEFQDLLGARLDQTYSLDDRGILLQFHKTGVGKRWIRISSRFLWVPAFKPATPERPSGFCALLRKTLAGAKLLSVEQTGAERAVVFKFGRKEGEFTIVAELFAKGNVILCDPSNKILGLIDEQTLGNRTLKRGVAYEAPTGSDAFSLTVKEFVATMKEATEPVAKALAARIGIGGTYAAELCARAGIDPQKAVTVESKLLALAKTLKAFADAAPEPVVVVEGGVAIDAAPWPLAAFKGKVMEKAQTFSEAIDRLLASVSQPAPVSTAQDKKRKKIEKAIEQQEAGAKGLEQKAAMLQRAGEICYERHAELQALMDEIKASRKGLSKEEMLKKFKAKGLKSYDPTTLDVEIESPD